MELHYFRLTQAPSYAAAQNDGSLRIRKLSSHPTSLEDGEAADYVAVITQAADMMDSGEKIAFYLFDDGDCLVDTTHVLEIAEVELRIQKYASAGVGQASAWDIYLYAAKAIFPSASDARHELMADWIQKCDQEGR